MALVSRKHNFIFVHIYRTGGNSVRKALGAPAVGSAIDILKANEELGVHVNAKDLRQHYHNVGDDNFWETAYKFAVVRNPFSWLVSTYKYIVYSPGHNFNMMVKSMTYMQFLEWYVNTAMTMDRPFGSNKYSTQYEFLYDDNGNRLVNYIGKVEQLGSALQRISKITGVPLQNGIPAINKTNPNLPGWKSYYNKQSVDFVNKHFEKDLETFNYVWR